MQNKNMNPSNSLNQTDEVENKVEFTHQQLHDALMHIQDMLERSQIPFMLAGDLGEQLNEDGFPTFHGDKVEIIVLERHWTKSGASIFKMLKPEAKVEKGRVTTEYQGVPIEIKIPKNRYGFLENPDTRFYTLTEFRLPNPFFFYLRDKERIE